MSPLDGDCTQWRKLGILSGGASMVNFPSHFLIAVSPPPAGPGQALTEAEKAEPLEVLEIVLFLRVQTGLESSIC